jgi:hypothetical protein
MLCRLGLYCFIYWFLDPVRRMLTNVPLPFPRLTSLSPPLPLSLGGQWAVVAQRPRTQRSLELVILAL